MTWGHSAIRRRQILEKSQGIEFEGRWLASDYNLC